MQRRPFGHELERRRRERADENREIVNRDNGVVLRVTGMEVRGWKYIVITIP